MKETKPTIPDLLALCDEAIRDDERATSEPVYTALKAANERVNAQLAESLGRSRKCSCRTRELVLARALREALVESARLKNAMRAILSGDTPTSETAAVCRHALGLHLSDFQRELARNCYYEAEADHLRVTIPEDLKDAAEAEQQGRSEP